MYNRKEYINFIDEMCKCIHHVDDHHGRSVVLSQKNVSCEEGAQPGALI